MMNDRQWSAAFGFDRPKAPRIAFAILAAGIATKLVLLFVLAWNSRFVMDEFWQLGNAKFLFNGFFDTVQPGKALGYAVFYKLAHLIGWNALSTLIAGRMLTALLACGTLGLVYASARALGESRLRALTCVLVLLSFSNFMERIFRTISEPLAVFFAAASLLMIMRGKADRARDVAVAGLFSGLAFLATQKSIYFNVALGVALVADAAIARRYAGGLVRGAWLVVGWVVPIVAYCLIFGGSDPLPIARHLLLDPFQVATRGTAEYGGLRSFVVQTLARNAIPYFFCFAGLALALLRVFALDCRTRVALIFSLIITVLIFTHDQPWPYVFIMALPFMSLWSLAALDRIAANPRHLQLALAVLTLGIAMSYVSNVRYLRIDNAVQRDLVVRAEALLRPNEHYFDGIGMVPNRRESTPLWLDRHRILQTLREGKDSTAYRGLAEAPPKLIIWSYRMDDIRPVIGPLIDASYVHVAPNLWMAGHRLTRGRTEGFSAPVGGAYQLYDNNGNPLSGTVELEGKSVSPPFKLAVGPHHVTLLAGPREALLLPEGSYSGQMLIGRDHPDLFAGVYD